MAQSLMVQRTWTFLILFVLIQGSLAAYLAKRTTITIPDGVTYHPESQDICTQTSWTDVVSFFVGNYLSHVATIVKTPGEPIYITGLNMFLVLLFPCFGAGRGLVTIYQRASFYKDPLQQALRAQALVMAQSRSARMNTEEYYQAAISKDWMETNSEKFKGYNGWFKMIVALPPWVTMHYGLTRLHMKTEKGYHVSGTCDLPEGYRLAYVPPNAQVEHIMPEVALSRILQTSYSLASGPAFGFTVTPYLVMSFLNLLANCFTPTFPNLCLVHTEIMDEAISRGGRFTDIVGKLESEPLLAEDLTLFGASIDPPQPGKNHDQYTCRIATQMYEPGSTEPMPDNETTKPEGHDGGPSVSDNIVTLATPLESAASPPDEEKAQKQAAATVEPDHPSGQPQTEADEEDEDDSVPTILIPSCYKFKIAYSNTSSTSILHKKKHFGPRGWLMGATTWGVAALPFIPLGVMSKFRTGTSSTIAQRVWLMAWYVVGTVSVSNPYFTDHLADVTYYNSRVLMEKRHDLSRLERAGILLTRAAGVLGMLIFYVTPAIGGFVVVGQMLIAYGSCTSL
ncbi:hypothetical protein ZTR_06663 [Talaromyces verruculosus]|nr:hypothetical protein ZTR_06663 [Talaromyces verruculosus]